MGMARPKMNACVCADEQFLATVKDGLSFFYFLCII